MQRSVKSTSLQVPSRFKEPISLHAKNTFILVLRILYSIRKIGLVQGQSATARKVNKISVTLLNAEEITEKLQYLESFKNPQKRHLTNLARFGLG